MEHAVQEMIPLWASTPFLLILMFIAVGPLLFHHWWENNNNKLLVSVILGVPAALYMIFNGLTEDLIHQMLFDYIPFIILLGSLFVITGGIQLKGNIAAKPITNTIFMGIGALLASFMGTTGAAMLLIRPIINTNAERKFKTHTILFFIAIVANCGGMLTPLGDPPLFLLYLRGAPFSWFFTLTKEWIFVNGILLLIYYFFDQYYHKKETASVIGKDEKVRVKMSLSGTYNFIFLIGVVLSVAFLNGNYIHAIHDNHYISFIREVAMLICAGLSMYFTPKSLRIGNKFTWGPIIEVAFLFLGIFITMVPTLIYLKQNAHTLGIDSATAFYYATGGLSAFLDNAPTALSFHNLASGIADNFPGSSLVAGVPEEFLTAISLGAVFFGAMTYIGNGPNFMVKAIAEENKITMPGFFEYMVKFSLIILLPVYILVQILFI